MPPLDLVLLLPRDFIRRTLNRLRLGSGNGVTHGHLGSASFQPTRSLTVALKDIYSSLAIRTFH
jgi:hypothetical protein